MMFDAFLAGLLLVFQWPTFGYLLAGVVSGILIGVIPGLGGGIGIVLLLPFTFGLDSVSAFALLLGMYAVTMTGDTVTSVMLGIPGTAASQATILDGYPLAKKGEAQRAFGAAYSCSVFGGIFGAIILAVSLPILKPLLRSFTNAELFMLGVLGISMVGALSGRSVFKGLATGCLGILISTIGYSENEAVPRFFFEINYLLDGAPLLPIVLGLFALPEMIDLAVRNISIARNKVDAGQHNLLWEGVKDAVKNWWLVIRSAAIGTYVGIIPGLGGSVTDWIAYGHAVQTTRKDPKFGEGDIRGVIAPETANNAMRGGGLIPTLVFGIPGTTGYAILLGGMLVHGLRPGPSMLTTELHLSFSMVWTIIIANIIAAGFLMVWSNQIAKIALLPGKLIVPGVILFVFMGAWMESSSIGDWITLIIFGTLGYLMKKGGWPRPPIILAFILGGIMENSFLITMNVHLGFSWLSRPIVLIILVIILITVVSAGYRNINKSSNKKNKVNSSNQEKNIKFISYYFGYFLLFVFLFSILWSMKWDESVRMFPLYSAVPGSIFVLISLTHGYFKIKSGEDTLILTIEDSKTLIGMVKFLGFLTIIVVFSIILGQKIVLPIFIFLFCRYWASLSLKISIIYCFLGWSILVSFYEYVLTIFWYPSLIGDFINSLFANNHLLRLLF